MSRLLKVAVQMDPMESVNIDGDSTFALMLEAQRRGHALWHYDVRGMSLQEGTARPDGARTERLMARVRPVHVQRVPGSHFRFDAPEVLDLSTMDTVLMRQDPPFDMAYITATHMLEHIHPRTLVVNDPKWVRDSPEKLLVTHFPDLMPPTLITWDPEAIRAFRAEHRDIIVKPLFGNGGAGVFRIREDDENLASLLEMHFARSREPLMIQRYEPAVRQGDKRVILIDGVARGAAYLFAGGMTVAVDNDWYSAIGNGRVAGIPVLVILTAIACLIMHYLLSQTRFGQHTYAMGASKAAANRAGINTKALTMKLYILSAIMAGVAGTLYTGRFTAGAAQAGEPLLLDSIAAVVIGGASLFGGSGTIWGTIAGSLVIAVIQYGLVFINVEPFWQFIAVGTVIIISVLVDQTQRRFTGGRQVE